MRHVGWLKRVRGGVSLLWRVLAMRYFQDILYGSFRAVLTYWLGARGGVVGRRWGCRSRWSRQWFRCVILDVASLNSRCAKLSLIWHSACPAHGLFYSNTSMDAYGTAKNQRKETPKIQRSRSPNYLWKFLVERRWTIVTLGTLPYRQSLFSTVPRSLPRKRCY